MSTLQKEPFHGSISTLLSLIVALLENSDLRNLKIELNVTLHLIYFSEGTVE